MVTESHGTIKGLPGALSTELSQQGLNVLLSMARCCFALHLISQVLPFILSFVCKDYLTKTRYDLMPKVKACLASWWEQVVEEVSEEELPTMVKVLDTMARNSG